MFLHVLFGWRPFIRWLTLVFFLLSCCFLHVSKDFSLLIFLKRISVVDNMCRNSTCVTYNSPWQTTATAPFSPPQQELLGAHKLGADQRGKTWQSLLRDTARVPDIPTPMTSTWGVVIRLWVWTDLCFPVGRRAGSDRGRARMITLLHVCYEKLYMYKTYTYPISYLMCAHIENRIKIT